MLVVNASNIEKDWDWITINNKNFNAEIVDRSNEISLLAIQGPKSIEAMQSLTKFKLDSFHITAKLQQYLQGVKMLL